MSAVKKKSDRQRIVERVLDFFERDEQARTEQKQDRLQRYAKFRMITPGSPGINARDCAQNVNAVSPRSQWQVAAQGNTSATAKALMSCFKRDRIVLSK